MPTELLILGALPWVFIGVYLVGKRAFVALLVALLAAPMSTYLTDRNLRDAVYEAGAPGSAGADFDRRSTVSLADILQPQRAVIGILFMFLAINTLARKRQRIRLDRTEFWMIVFTILLIFNVLLFSRYFGYGLRVATDSFIVPFLTYYFMRRVVINDERFWLVTHAIAYMGAYVVLFCFIERLIMPGLFYRIRGPFDSGNTLHVVMSVVFFTVWALQPSERTGVNRFVRYFILLSVPVVVALSLARANWLAFLLGLAAVVYLGRHLLDRKRMIGASGFAILLVLLSAITIALAVPDTFFEARVANPKNILGRFATWQAVSQHGFQAPMFGIGLNNLRTVLRKPTLEFGTYMNYQTVHNSYLSIFVELGAVGFLAFWGIITSIFQNGLRLYRDRWNDYHRRIGISVIAIMIAYLVPAMFANTLYIPGLIQFYVYAIIGAVAGAYGSIPRQSLSYRFHDLQLSIRRSAFSVQEGKSNSKADRVYNFS